MISKDFVNKETKVALKFLLSRIKASVIDSRGRMTRISNFDDVIDDIFGYRKLGTKINNCHDDMDTVVAINHFGFENMMTLFADNKSYMAFNDLVSMNQRIDEIKRSLKRAEKKGKKKDKDLIKELEYLKDLYKSSIKILRKKFGVSGSKKKRYKNRYRGAANLIREKDSFGYYDDEHSLFDDDDEDDDDKRYDIYSPNFKLKSRKLGSNFGGSILENIDTDEDDDDDDEESDDISDALSEQSDSISKIQDAIIDLSSTMQQMANMQMSMTKPNYTAPRDTLIENHALQNKPINELTGQQSFTTSNKLENTVLGLTKCIQTLAEKVDTITETQDEICEFINDMEVNDSDDYDDYGYDDIDCPADSIEQMALHQIPQAPKSGIQPPKHPSQKMNVGEPVSAPQVPFAREPMIIKKQIIATPATVAAPISSSSSDETKSELIDKYNAQIHDSASANVDEPDVDSSK